MTRRLLLLLFGLYVVNNLAAQFPALNNYSVSNITTVTFQSSRSANKGKTNAEVPPWIIPGGLRTYFFVDGNGTNIWSTGASLVTNNTINLDKAAGPYRASSAYMSSITYSPFNNIQNWKRNYHGIYSAAYIHHPAKGAVTLAFLHGENKNQVVGSKRYQNTIQANVPINMSDPASYSGGTPFHDGWNAYNAIISAAWVPNNAQTNWGQQSFDNELGPIVWPSTGYVTKQGVKCTSGLKHPSCIVTDKYVYIYYAEGGAFGSNIPDEEGRHEGIKVVRAPVADALNPGSYRVYYRDAQGNDHWNPSLPEGFTKENMLQYVAVRGPKATDIMDDEKAGAQEVRFSVAKVRNTDYYIGIEQYIDVKEGLAFKVALRFSADLVHWSERVMTVYTARNWDASAFNYPVFMSKDGWTNTEIDIDDFYVLGTGTTPGKFVNRIHITVAANSTASFITINQPSAQLNADKICPNPTAGICQLSYTLYTSSSIQIALYTVTGHKLADMVDEIKAPGNYTQQFNLNTYPRGIYLVELLVQGKRHTYKVLKG